jgi:two-component system, LuxR family, response regulator FixJ
MSTEAVVSIVDDDPDIRDSLSMLLQSEGIATREFASAEEFLSQGLGGHGGCVLADIRMPGMDGFALLGMIAARKLTIPVIMMTGHGDVPMAVSAMKQGATDFIQKPINAETLLALVRQALSKGGEPAPAPAVDVDPQLLDRLSRLTEREREVFELLVDGDPNKVVAYKLSISPRTVEIHRARVMEKLNLRNVAELVRVGLSLRALPQAAKPS